MRTRYQFISGKADGSNISPSANTISLPEAYSKCTVEPIGDLLSMYCWLCL